MLQQTSTVSKWKIFVGRGKRIEYLKVLAKFARKEINAGVWAEVIWDGGEEKRHLRKKKEMKKQENEGPTEEGCGGE
jgi:hypothetical protein